MKHLIKLFTLIALLYPATALALSYNTDNLPYVDTPPNDDAALAVSVLTEQGILKGNPDGTYGWQDSLNRAAFVTIIMRLTGEDLSPPSSPCFPDVGTGGWYAGAVCKAKQQGIVRGNAQAGVPEDQWLFAPSRTVQYEEAAKILAGVYNYNVRKPAAGEQWYAPFIQATESRGTQLGNMRPGSKLNRAQMGQFAVRFLSESKEELQTYLQVAKKEEKETEEDKKRAEANEKQSPDPISNDRELFSGNIETVEIDGKTFTIFPLSSNGKPLSSDPLWNLCIQGYRPEKNGEYIDCGRLFDTEGKIWRHPDLDLRFEFTTNSRYVKLPKGYITREEANEKQLIEKDHIDLETDDGTYFVLGHDYLRRG